MDDNKVFELVKEMNKYLPYEVFNLFYIAEKGIYSILEYLINKENAVLAGELSQELNVSTARIAFLLKKMEMRGLIRKIKPINDKRKTLVLITDKGKNLIIKLKNKLILDMQNLVDKIGIEDIETFIKISKKIKISIGETNLGYLNFQKIL